MAVHIKNEEEQEHMRAASKLASQTLEFITPHVVAGVTTQKLDDLIRDFTHDHGAVCAPFNYHGFPGHCCISVNDVACHGIPGAYELTDGDIVNVDVSPKLDGWHGDTSKMFMIGDVTDEDRELCTIAYEAMWAGIKAVRPGEDISVVGNAIQRYIADQPAQIAKGFCGHGIGRNFHEEPQVLHHAYHRRLMPVEIQPGMTFTVEPIINRGVASTITSSEDHWTVTTADGSKSAQWEHTVLVTEDGYTVLTLREEEKGA